MSRDEHPDYEMPHRPIDRYLAISALMVHYHDAGDPRGDDLADELDAIWSSELTDEERSP